MARISTYTIEQPTIDDFLIGTDADSLDSTKNYLIGDIIKLIPHIFFNSILVNV